EVNDPSIRMSVSTSALGGALARFEFADGLANQPFGGYRVSAEDVAGAVQIAKRGVQRPDRSIDFGKAALREGSGGERSYSNRDQGGGELDVAWQHLGFLRSFGVYRSSMYAGSKKRENLDAATQRQACRRLDRG